MLRWEIFNIEGMEFAESFDVCFLLGIVLTFEIFLDFNIEKIYLYIKITREEFFFIFYKQLN